ncbi:MAG TPA: hypothetical protein LFV92_01830 [Rickettsia endosymbiont of Ceroptres masudai]|nr:hypothetical protein [Rickettsia endosymbiont of Ceroptres masudai]
MDSFFRHLRGKTVSFDEEIQLKMLIFSIFLIIFTGLPARSSTARNDEVVSMQQRPAFAVMT